MVEMGMKRISNLLTTAVLATALVGTAFAQEAREFKWRADTNNHGWHVATSGPGISSMINGRAMRMVPTKWVTLTIDKVAQIDNLDQGDPVGKNRADFFAMVWVDGQLFKSKNYSKDEGRPNWVLKVPVYSESSKIRIKLMDDDGGLEQRDDHVDINPNGGQKDLIVDFNSATGQVSGDAAGAAGSWITSAGAGDDDRGTITFSISS